MWSFLLIKTTNYFVIYLIINAAWSLLDNAGAYCSEQLVIKVNALYLAVFPAYKIDHLINETGITKK